MENNIDKPSLALRILTLFIPLVGLILYFVKKSEYPVSAKSYLTWAGIGFVVNFFLHISGFWEGFWHGFWVSYYGI